MINVDISNVWCGLSLPDLLGMEREVFDAHAQLVDGTGAGAEFRDWLNLPQAQTAEEMERILQAAEKIRSDSDVCVVVGIGGGCLGSRAVIELLRGSGHNIGKGRGDPQIFFAGNTFSTRRWNALTRLLEGKDFSLIVISKSGTTLESAIAFRGLRWLLERKYGSDEAAERIYVVTDPVCGTLHRMAKAENWETFFIPVGVEGCFSVLSPAGLLPMAVAGIDIQEILRGAAEAKAEYDLRSFENPVWLYAGVRNALYRQGRHIEILESFEPDFGMFGRWWQQLFGEPGGKNIFPVTAELTADLPSLGQSSLFETMIRFDGPEKEAVIGSDWKNLDGLNYLEGNTLDFVDRTAFAGIVAAHEENGIPVLTMDCGALKEQTVGELIWFFQLACGISACILGVDPLDRSGVENYKRNLFDLLGKPDDLA